MKSNLHACLAFSFMFSREQIIIAIRVAFNPHRAFQRGKQADSSWRERCRLPTYRINSLFFLWRDTFQRPSARSLWPSHLPANIEPQSTGRRTRTEFTRVHMHVTVTTIGAPSWKKHDSSPVSKFAVSMKHQVRLGIKNSLWSTEAQRRACWRSDRSRRTDWVRQTVFQCLCTCVCP